MQKVNNMPENTEDFVNNLLSQMTIEEKIGQLNQYSSSGNLDSEVIRGGNAGSVINASGALTGQEFSGWGYAAINNHIQQMALESRLKIPLIFGRDVIHGYRTVFPIPLAQAATFNPDMVEQAASVAAMEATADGIKWTFAPMIDIARDPRWGRVAEGSGEDPFLGAQMAAGAVRGLQGNDYSASDKLVACAKHFVGYGAAEGGRDYDGGEISEPTLRDVYLPPYRAAVNAGVGTLMSAFIDLNGVPATANRRLLTDLLRGEWGFDGFVVSDWDSVEELVSHGVAEDEADASILALRAGLDMDMVSGVYLKTLAESLRNGKISLDVIEGAVRRILRIKHRAGLFDHPLTDPDRATRSMLLPTSRELARQFARDCMVLLKNEKNILPLNGFKKILFAGNFVHAQGELFGIWTPDGRWEEATSIQDALREVSPKDVELWFAETPDLALAFAQHVDVVVLLLGEHPLRSGENSNVSDLGLPPGQAEFISAMAGLGKPLVLVIFAGRPLAITRQVAQADAVLYAWHPGIEGGAALGEILFGLESPSGRLPITFPRATGQVPIYYNHKNSGRPIRVDGEFRTRYVDLPTAPLFPFGCGRTYTSFDYANLQLSNENIRGSLEISADVTNTGSRAGKELVQLYVRDLVGSLTRPVRELKGFQHVSLNPGETCRVTFTLYEEQLAFTRADGTHGTEPGNFHVWIAPDSLKGLRGEFKL
jgi:beta-glucosidase